MSKSKLSSVRERDIRRHPIFEFQAALKKGRISRLPQLCPTFKVGLPVDEDFIVRFRRHGARPIVATFVRNRYSGQICAFADRQVEIELIGNNDERWERFVAAERKKAKLSKSRR